MSFVTVRESSVDTPPTVGAPPGKRHLGRRLWRNKWFLRGLSLVAVLTVWQLVGRNLPYTTSYPGAVWESAKKTFFPDVLPAFRYTLATFGIGFAICVAVGIPVGFAMARLKLVQLVLEPYTVMLFSVPFLALFPVLILAFGVSFGLRVAVVVITGIFPIIINTFLGAQHVDQALADVGKTFVASKWKTLSTIVAPGSLPYIFAGVRIGFARGMIGAVVVELEASAVGVGSILEKDAQNIALDNFFVVVLLLGAFSLAVSLLIRYLEVWSTQPWTRRRNRNARRSPVVVAEAPPPLRRREPTSLQLRVRRAVAPVRSAWAKFRPVLDKTWFAWTVRIVVLAAILGYWQYQSQYISRAVLPSPGGLAQSGWDLIFVSHELIAPALNSLTVLVIGFALSVIIGIPIGLAMGRSMITRSVLDPYVSFIYALPHVVFVPLMIVWLGFGMQFRVAYVVISAVFPVIINTMTGVTTIDPELINTGRSFCASRKSIMRTIIIPATTPFMIAGARLAFSAAWVGVVVSEILTTQEGLGGLITKFSDAFRTADMIVPIVAIMAIAVLILQATTYAQKRLTPWYEADIRR
jgi:NitT/TauT family transport system permease protein